jgi:Na+/H+-dicarboxylate symporter
MFSSEFTNGTNILGLVVFSIITGVAIACVGEEGKPLLNFFHSVSATMMKVFSSNFKPSLEL